MEGEGNDCHEQPDAEAIAAKEETAISLQE